MIRAWHFAAAHLLLALAAGGAQAQNAHLVRDIRSADLPFGVSSNPGQFTPLGDRAAFVADEPGSGLELWISDGSAEGTALLADVCPGECDGLPQVLGTAGGVILWIASPPMGEAQLWRSNGTPEGTWPLPSPGRPLQIPRRLFGEPGGGFERFPYAFREGLLYFGACGTGGSCGLWRTDGTAAGTRRVAGAPLLKGPHFSAFAAVENAVVFLQGRSLWATDGSTAGTVRLRTFPAAPRALTAAGRRAFFTAPATGEELWTTDGTPGGTIPLTRFAPAEPFGFFPLVQTVGPRLYVVADDGIHGRELWRSNGTPGGTRRVTDLEHPAPFTPGNPDRLVAEVGGRIVVGAYDAQGRPKLWAGTGDPRSLQPIEILGNHGGYLLQPLLALGGRMLFSAIGPRQGDELWSTDGTLAGTRLVRDICPGSCGSAISSFSRIAGKALFSANEGLEGPRQIWSSDGTPEGTRALTDFTGASGPAWSLTIARAGGKLFFNGFTPEEGLEPWVLENGTARQVANLQPEVPSSFPHQLTAAGDSTFLFALPEGDNEIALWRSLGTEESTEKEMRGIGFMSAPCDHAACPRQMTAAAGGVFFVESRLEFPPNQLWWMDAAGTAPVRLTFFDRTTTLVPPLLRHQDRVFFLVGRASGHELWRSDGTPGGTVHLADLGQIPDPRELTAHVSAPDGLWLGITDDGNNGSIWRSDGTPEGTARRIELPGWTFAASRPFVATGGAVYFIARHVHDGGALWRTDGTPEGTFALTAGPGLDPFGLEVLGGAVFFLALGPDEAKRGLWRSDGTPAGTQRLRALRFRENDTPPLVAFAGRLFFAAAAGSEGIELWSTDGTTAGTAQVRDISFSRTGSFPSQCTAAGGKLFFTAHDGIHGFELWETDGTGAGTRLVQDIAPGPRSSRPAELTAVGSRLDFVADDGSSGRELWSLPLGTQGAAPRRR